MREILAGPGGERSGKPVQRDPGGGACGLSWSDVDSRRPAFVGTPSCTAVGITTPHIRTLRGLATPTSRAPLRKQYKVTSRGETTADSGSVVQPRRATAQLQPRPGDEKRCRDTGGVLLRFGRQPQGHAEPNDTAVTTDGAVQDIVGVRRSTTAAAGEVQRSCRPWAPGRTPPRRRRGAAQLGADEPERRGVPVLECRLRRAVQSLSGSHLHRQQS